MKLSEKLILTDVDGVLLDWNFSFEMWMKARGHIKVDSGYNLATSYDITQVNASYLSNMFCHSREISRLVPFRDAIQYVRKLHEEYGYVFQAITAISDDERTLKNRWQNLENLFGKGVFHGLDHVGAMADKTIALTKYKDSGCFWVEDHFNNSLVGAKLGLQSLLMDHTYNQDTSNPENIFIKRVYSWKHIYQMAHITF